MYLGNYLVLYISVNTTNNVPENQYSTYLLCYLCINAIVASAHFNQYYLQ